MCEQRVVHRLINAMQMGLTLCVFVLVGPWTWAADNDPLIVFDDVRDGERVYSYFDTADPGMSEPVEIARVPDSEKMRCIGVFNGVLFVVEESGELYGVDLGTGARLPLNFTLPKRYVQEDAMIYIPPGGTESAESRTLDLRGPFVRTLAGFPEEDGKKPRVASSDRLRYLTFESVSATVDTRQLKCAVFDLRAPEGAVAEFTVTIRRTWRVGNLQSGFHDPSMSDAVIVRPVELFEAPVVVWTGGGTIACVALAVEFEGMNWEGEADGGPTLFVMDIESRNGRVLPLSTLPAREPNDALEAGKGDFGGYDPNAYGIDTATMGLLDFNELRGAQNKESLGEHFSIAWNSGPLQVLHGGQPLDPKQIQDITNAVADSSGERILQRSRTGFICYDIYYGYFAESTARGGAQYQERSELHRVEVAPAEGWSALVTTPITGKRDEDPAPGRRDRASSYSLVASPGKATYSDGDLVVIHVALTNVGTEAQWTDVPTSDFPTLSGTLAGSVYASTLSSIPTLKPIRPAVPVYLEVGDTLSTTLEFTPEASGVYTLALAYGGNPESEWYGRAKAPLARFTVGNAGVDDEARLRYAIQNFGSSGLRIHLT